MFARSALYNTAKPFCSVCFNILAFLHHENSVSVIHGFKMRILQNYKTRITLPFAKQSVNQKTATAAPLGKLCPKSNSFLLHILPIYIYIAHARIGLSSAISPQVSFFA